MRSCLLLLTFLITSCRFAGVCTSSAEECAREEKQWSGESTNNSCESGTLNGLWTLNNSSTLRLKKDCSFFTTNTLCVLTGAYAYSSSATNCNLTVSTSSDETLCPLGAYTCTYSATATNLSMDCTYSSNSNKKIDFIKNYVLSTRNE